MPPRSIRSSSQQSFAAAVSRVIRESRRRQKLTQAELAHRTGGLVTKAALALMTTAQTYIRSASTASAETVIVDVPDLLSRNDPQLAGARRWFEMRRHGQITLNQDAITALARLMDVSEPECRRIVGRSRLDS